MQLSVKSSKSQTGQPPLLPSGHDRKPPNLRNRQTGSCRRNPQEKPRQNSMGNRHRHPHSNNAALPRRYSRPRQRQRSELLLHTRNRPRMRIRLESISRTCWWTGKRGFRIAHCRVPSSVAHPRPPKDRASRQTFSASSTPPKAPTSVRQRKNLVTTRMRPRSLQVSVAPS